MFFVESPEFNTERDSRRGSAHMMGAISNTVHDAIGILPGMPLTQKIRLVLNAHKLHLVMAILVVLDSLCVLAQIVLDIISVHSSAHYLHLLELIAEFSSLFILSIFIVEIFFKLIFTTKSFFKSKLELFDAVIVCISFSLEIVSIAKRKNVQTIAIVSLMFRFWRIIRIANGKRSREGYLVLSQQMG